MKINYFIALIGVFLLFNIGQSCAMKPASRPSIEEALQLAITNREDAINRLEAFAKSADIREASLATGQLIKMGQIDRLNSLKEASKKKHSQQSIRAHIMLAIYNANSHNIEDLSTSIRLLTRALKEIEAAPRTSSFPADYAPYCRNFLTQFFGVNSTVLSDAQITEQASEALWRITQENRPSDMEAILNRFMKNKSNPYYYHAAAQLAGLHCAQLFQQSSFDKAHHLASLLLNQSSFPLLASGHFILGELAKFKGKYEDAQNHLQQAAGFGLFIPVPAMQLISLKAKISLADLEAKKDISRAIAMLKGLIPIESRFGLMSFNALRTKFLLADYLMAQDSANSHESKAIYEEIANQDEVPGLAAYAQRRLSELTTPAHLTQFLQETLLHQAITIEQNSPQEARSQSSAESKSTKLPTPQLNTELPMDDHVSNDNTQQADEDRAFDLEYHQLHEQLLTAIKRNQPTRVRELLKQGADPFYLIGSKRIIDHAIACAENDAIITLIAPETAHPSTALPATHATYQIEWNKEAKKQFDKLQGMEQNKIHEALEAAANKLNPHVKKLQGKQPFQYRIAVGNRLRIGFNYSDDGKGIVVMYAGYHEHCYE